ncbi:MAG: hypothetical protein ACRENP_18300 [Longimicrobiales bacterium]
MSFGEDVPARDSESRPRMLPLRSRFPGELALRDARDGSVRQAQVCAARFAVLQLVERFVDGAIDTTSWAAELETAAAYVDPLNEKLPQEAQGLHRVLQCLDRDYARNAPAALLPAGDGALACGHLFGAWGLYRTAFELAAPMGRSAVALSAASRLSELAARLDRPGLGHKWSRRCARLIALCH